MSVVTASNNIGTHALVASSPPGMGLPKTLPVEVIERIFKYATSFPDELDSEVKDHFTTPDHGLVPLYNHKIADMNGAFAFKHRLLVLSKGWYKLLAGSLYEVVTVKRGKQLAALHRILLQDQCAARQHIHVTLSQTIRRLTIYAEYGCAGADQDPVEEELDQLADIFSWAIRVKILTIQWRCLNTTEIQELPLRCVNAINCIWTLEKVHLDGLQPNAVDARDFMSRCPHLHTFIVTGKELLYAVVSPRRLVMKPGIKFFTLNALWKVYKDEPVEPNPTLKMIHIPVGSPPNQVQKAARCREVFLSAQGRHLQTVFLEADFTNALTKLEEMQSCVDQLDQFCTRLAHLVFIAPTLWFFPHVKRLPPTLTYIGLWTPCAWALDCYWSRFFASLAELTREDVPMLKAFRFLDRELVTDFRRQLAEGRDVGAEHIRRCIFRVEDHRGDELLPAGLFEM
ncbi:hypothetical protein EVG20_g8446 [Dentipellis fragilis]|uniref:F-box domain-containing protein n=1 Tax=Dentipellis fragilis TaxID=205917 RepID=A0A4Y9Y697_9AGAM|nr:hypothetical protein EVG20_g8446 [Dentipellis fragilis]